MRDLEIWRRLTAGNASADDLRELATMNLGRRVAFVGAVLPYVTNEVPELRAAALAALSGARGMTGVRTIVARLDDDDAGVRAAAVAALHEVARDAPLRFVHALFHPRVEVRRAALACELSTQLAELAIYLRADRECADATTYARWPDGALPLALDMYRSGHIAAGDVVALLVQTPTLVVVPLLARSPLRAPDVVDAFLERAARETAAPPGRDMLDTIVHAIIAAGAPAAALEHFVATVTPRGDRALPRRAVVALLAQLDPTSDPALWGTCVALEPRVLGFARFPAALVDAAIAGLFRHKWPTRPATAQTERLLALPLVQGDLALAAAIAGLLPSQRLAKLAELLGEDAIVERLRAGDRGWEEICRLPHESPPRDLAWLARIQKSDHARYVALAGRALGAYSGKQLESFVDQMQRRHRPAVFAAALAAHANASHERVAAVCHAISSRCDRVTLAQLLQHLLATDEHGRLVLALVRVADAKLLGSAARDLDDAAAVRLVGLLDADPAPRDRELALARAFATRTLPVVDDWRSRVYNILVAPVPVTVIAPRVRRELAPSERRAIETCAHRDLDLALKPAFGGLVSGLCAALAARVHAPSIAACNALLGCSDPLVDVSRQLDRFAATTAQFDAELDDAAVIWVRTDELPPLAHARLWRWDAHGFALADWIESMGGALAALVYADKLRGLVARHTVWKGVSEALMLLRYRALERFKRLTVDLAPYCAMVVDRDIGRHAARIVAALVESGTVAIGAIRDVLQDRIADADAEAREYIARLLRLQGLPEPPPSSWSVEPVLIEQIRACQDVDQLAGWCRDPRPALVQEAALALCVLGAPGQLRLAALLADRDHLPVPIPLLQTILLWDHAEALDAIRELSRAAELPPAWQFHLALGLHARGEPGALERAFGAVRAAPQGWYFRREDWDTLAAADDVVACSLALVDAPHHHAYQRAVGTLLSLTDPEDDVRAALVRFLEIGSDRPLHLRVAVARRLAEQWDDATGLPVLAEYIADERADDWLYTLELVPKPAMAAIAELVVSAALVGGPLVCSEKRMWLVMQRLRSAAHLDGEQLAELDMQIFEHAATANARRAAGQFAVSYAQGHARLARVAEVFAWGVKRGVELTGGLYRIHMTAKEREFGHTRLDGKRIFVSPLPMLRGETNGQDIVEGLVLHELGHHVYHRGEAAQKLWKRAHDEGIGHFLNLIADEHLERNLRALDPAYGDRLKRLGAYAFHHAPQEIKVLVLTSALGAATAHALSHAELEVAYDEEAVRLRRGAILGELDRAGHPVARFSRALRMGLGNRTGDPLIAQALALCGKELRALDMQGLYDLTQQLVALFGGQIEIAKVFGGPEGLAFGERDDDVFGAGIDDDILQREVERILDPRQAKGGGTKGGGARLAINVSPDAEFDRITHVQRVRGNAEVHRKLALDVNRHSTRLRAFLDELGLRWLPMRARTQGRALDRTRLRALVTRNDPRILIARTPRRKTDLFLGTIVDCSGSMSAGNNIERAKRFAILVAEAVRPLAGVEARFFGFTDSVIYDAGNAHDCHVVALETSGGNNDAAALYHAAGVALASQQRAKVLVMISDGLPTECSVVALRSLVDQLTKRRGIICAQVAVRRLEEVCFPNYIVLDDSEPDVAVAKFGRMIGDLARRSLTA